MSDKPQASAPKAPPSAAVEVRRWTVDGVAPFRLSVIGY